MRDTSPHGGGGVVRDVKILPVQTVMNYNLRQHVGSCHCTKRKIRAMAGRHGNSDFCRSEHIQSCHIPPSTQPVDIMLNPLGVPSREYGRVMNFTLVWQPVTWVFTSRHQSLMEQAQKISDT